MRVPKSIGSPLVRLTRWAAMAAILWCGSRADATTIVVNFSGVVPQGAQNVFNNVIIPRYDALFSNAGTINITVDFESLAALANNVTTTASLPYATWVSDMKADSTANPGNPYLAAAVSKLPASDPIGNGNVYVTFADLLALGQNVSGTFATLNFSTNYAWEYLGVAASGDYDFTTIAEHELNEALGLQSALNGTNNGGSLPTEYQAYDYFRYSSSGTRLPTTSSSAAVYFSYNGTTDVAQFNQNVNPTNIPNDPPSNYLDYSGWMYASASCPGSSPGPYINDSVGCPDTNAILLAATMPESIALQTLGWDEVPEPAPMTLVGLGLGAALLIGRKKQRGRGTV